MPNDFSFAPHESDPTDIAKNPMTHHATATGGGAINGALMGAGIGTGVALGMRRGFRAAGKASFVGGIFGAGLGAGLGYHDSTTKQRAVEHAYGAFDPFELQKLSSEHAYAAGQAFARQALLRSSLHSKAASFANYWDKEQALLARKNAVEDAVRNFDYRTLLDGEDLWNTSMYEFHELAREGNLHVHRDDINRHISLIRTAEQQGPHARIQQDKASRAELAHIHNLNTIEAAHPGDPEISDGIMSRHLMRSQAFRVSQTRARTNGGPTPSPHRNPGATSQTPGATPQSPPPGPSASGPAPGPSAQPGRGPSARPSPPPVPPQQTMSEAAQSLWANHKGKLALGAAALGLSGLGYHAYLENQRRGAEALFQPASPQEV